MKRPKIICFCGSTRFTVEMMVVRWEYEKAGHIVLTWNVLPDSYIEHHHKGQVKDGGLYKNIADAEGVKEQMDELHKRKIDLADEVLVINIGGYIGESTRSEIEYANKIGVHVKYLEVKG